MFKWVEEDETKWRTAADTPLGSRPANDRTITVHGLLNFPTNFRKERAAAE